MFCPFLFCPNFTELSIYIFLQLDDLKIYFECLVSSFVDLNFLGVDYWKFIVFLWFHCFFVFLAILHWYLQIWRSNHLLQTLWTGLSGERHSPTDEGESSGWEGHVVALGLGICEDTGSRGIQEHWFCSRLCSSGWQGLREQCTAATPALARAQSFHLLSGYATLPVCGCVHQPVIAQNLFI